MATRSQPCLDLGGGVKSTSYFYQSFFTRLTIAYIKSNVYHVSKFASNTALMTISTVPSTFDKHLLHRAGTS